MSWGTRHDSHETNPSAGGGWDLSEGFLHPEAGTPPRAPKRHSPSGEADGDDGAGNALPREGEGGYGLEDEEADDWIRADSDEARF